jgi:hypothetical protein
VQTNPNRFGLWLFAAAAMFVAALVDCIAEHKISLFAVVGGLACVGMAFLSPGQDRDA